MKVWLCRKLTRYHGSSIRLFSCDSVQVVDSSIPDKIWGCHSLLLRVCVAMTPRPKLPSLTGNRDHAELTCSAILALFNSMNFVKQFHTLCSKKHQQTEQPLDTKALLETLEKILNRSKPKRLFRSSFDKRQHNNPDPTTVTSRLEKVKKFHLKNSLRGGWASQQPRRLADAQATPPGRTAASRKTLCLAYASQLSVLLGRNVLLEPMHSNFFLLVPFFIF